MTLFEKIREFPYILAPLAGYSDHPYRMVAKDYGVSLVFTEMINIHTMVKGPRKLGEFTYHLPEEKPIGVQLFGGDPELFYVAAKEAEEFGFDIIDINMGCPVKKVVKTEQGANLMRNLPLAEQIVREVVRAVKVPVSIKIRMGWDSESVNFMDFNKMAEDNGVSMITLHARTRTQMFTGHSDWNRIAELKSKSKLFVVGNGDVFDRISAHQMIDETRCDAVMIGRGAIGNPFLFKEIRDPSYRPTLKEKIKLARRHFDLLYDFKGERGMLEMRKFFIRYIKDFSRAAFMRQDLVTLDDPAEIRKFLENAEQKL